MSGDQDGDRAIHQDVSPGGDAYVAGGDLHVHMPPGNTTGGSGGRAGRNRAPWWRRPAIAASGICACVVIALAVAFGVKAGPFSPSPSGHLSISTVSFVTQDGKLTLVVTGMYHLKPGDGYIFAVARPSVTPPGTSPWLASPPVTPDENGQWTADIMLTGPRQRLTVFAVLAGGCPPGNACGVDPNSIQFLLEQEGPQAANYSTAPKVAS